MSAGSIWTRIAVESEQVLPESEQPLDLHRFCAALRLLAYGHVTAAQVASRFALDGEGQSDLTALRQSYVAAADKNEWLHSLEATALLLNRGDITETKAKQILGVI